MTLTTPRLTVAGVWVTVGSGSSECEPGIARIDRMIGCRRGNKWNVSDRGLRQGEGPRGVSGVYGMVLRLRLGTGEREDEQVAIGDPGNQQLIIGRYVPT